MVRPPRVTRILTGQAREEPAPIFLYGAPGIQTWRWIRPGPVVGATHAELQGTEWRDRLAALLAAEPSLQTSSSCTASVSRATAGERPCSNELAREFRPRPVTPLVPGTH